MKIVDVQALPVTIPYLKPFVTAYGSRAEKEHVVVKIETDEGIIGYGESAPVPKLSGDQQAEIAVINRHLKPVLLGENPLRIEYLLRQMDLVLGEFPLAKAGIEIALHDIVGRYYRTPVHNLIGGLFRDKIPVVGLISMGQPNEMAAEAVEAVQKGYKTVKLKIGSDLATDIVRVKAVREAVGPDIALRVDANMAWSAKEAVFSIKKLERFELEMVEQPVPRWDINGLSKIVRVVDVPIMVDESVFSPHEAMNVIRAEAADIINIKVNEAGGIRNSMKIVSISEAAGIPNIVGSMLTFAIGTAASLQLAAATSNVSYACEMVGFTFLKDDLAQEGFKVEEGYIKVPDKPGLGIDVDEGKLKRYLAEAR